MACRNAFNTQTTKEMTAGTKKSVQINSAPRTEMPMFFGVDSNVRADDLLQNHITEFEWVLRNKIYPHFWGRNMVGENSLTKEEIHFLHGKACKIAPIYKDADEKITEEQGRVLAKKIEMEAMKLGIPEETAIFLEIEENETATRDFMRGYAKALLKDGYIPAFRADTDAMYDFDREFSRGMQTDRAIFTQCLIWALSPTVQEYDGMTTTHLIHPDCWKPYAPSGLMRNEIAVWQYGKNCHPIYDDEEKETTFNLNLVLNNRLIVDRMF